MTMASKMLRNRADMGEPDMAALQHSLTLVSLALILIETPYRAGRAETRCAQPIGEIASVQGMAEISGPGHPGWMPVQLGDPVCPSDSLHVGDLSRAAIVLQN